MWPLPLKNKNTRKILVHTHYHIRRKSLSMSCPIYTLFKQHLSTLSIQPTHFSLSVLSLTLPHFILLHFHTFSEHNKVSNKQYPCSNSTVQKTRIATKILQLEKSNNNKISFDFHLFHLFLQPNRTHKLFFISFHFITQKISFH